MSITAYIPIPVATLVPAAATGFSLYVRERGRDSMTLYRDRGIPFEPEHAKRLQEAGVTRLYVTSTDHRAYQDYLRGHFTTVLRDERIAPRERFGTLNVVMREVLKETFEQRDIDNTVDEAMRLSECTVDMLCRNDLFASDISQVLHHDYHTFTHSANVAYYCVMLAQGLGVTDRAELVEMATGGLLHDIGKLEIPSAILTKPGRLTAAEFEVIKTHPGRGFRMLSHRKDLSLRQRMMVYQHHERLDGSGYSVGACGDEIDRWALICAVADVYEALTSNRPYRRGLPRNEALQILDRDAGKALDPEMVECWKRIILSN